MKRISLLIVLMMLFSMMASLLFAEQVTIGAGDQNARMPMDFYWKNSLFQCLFFPDELGFVSGTISHIQFYNNFTTHLPNGATKIWLGTTQQGSLSGGYIPSTQLTLVFDGTVDYPSGENTISIQLQTPYMHTPGNLVLMVNRPMDATYYSSMDYFKCQTIGADRAMNNYSDGTAFDPASPGIGTLSGQFPKTTFTYSGQPLVNDLSCSSIIGNLTPTVGNATTYQVTIRNNGSVAQSNYQVKIMRQGGIELAFVAGPAINPQQTIQIPIIWTPATAGEAAIYGQVFMANDEIGQNNISPSINVVVQPEGIQAVTIGVGNSTNRMPMDFYYRASLFECLYYQDELGFGSGTITGIQFYNSFSTNNPNGAVQIYLGSTQLQDLSAGYIPASQMVLVYDGNVSFPSGQNNININLQTPFMHVAGNLVMMVVRPFDTQYYNYEDNFFCQTVGTNRARNTISDSSGFDPNNPPAGSLSGIFPKTTFFYTGQLIENDLGCLYITGNPTPTAEISYPYTIGIRNNGNDIQSNYQVKIMEQGGGEIASIAGPSISPQQTLEVVINWTPATAGVYTIYGKVVLDGDEIEQNNQCGSIVVQVLPPGLQQVTIGSGDQDALIPVNMFYCASLYQCLFYPDELGFITGTIMNIMFYNNFLTNLANKPIQIWLGSTQTQDLSGGYISASQMTLAFDGTVNFPSGQNEILIPLTTPFYHSHGNLVMMVRRPLDTGYFSSMDYFKCQTVGTNRARNQYSDSINYDPMNPPAGTLSGQFPKTGFFYIGQAIDNDLSCYNLTGNTTPTVGIAANYTVTIRNNGAAVQNTYLVKMKQQGGGELVSVAGPAINPQQVINVNLSWTPTTAGVMSIYGEVVLDGDEINQNNQTVPMLVSVQPEGIQAVTIGAGGEQARIPMDFWMRNSIYECLYYPDELGFVSGTITTIQLYNNFMSNMPNGATKIWLGSTNQADLSAGMIPATQMTQVYDGNVSYPTGQNNINIPLTTPYFHTPGNLVMMVQRPMDTTYYSSSDYFICQTLGSTRARNIYSDSEVFDPNSPPAGTLSGQFPKTTFFYTGEAIENDIGCYGLSGNTTPTVGAASAYTIVIKNNGSEPQNDYQVKLFTQGDVEVASIAGPAINSLQTLNVVLNWTPTTSGSTYIYGKVVMDGDEIAQNNQTANLNVYVNPAGVFTLTVGTGTEQARVPVDMYWRSSIFETLYYPAEMGGFTGQITALQFYNNFTSNLMDMPTQIWLGTTTQPDLTDGWIPSSQLTSVFDGVVNYPSGQNTIMIPLDEHFLYINGENLVMLVHRPQDVSWHSSMDYFKSQSQGTNRARNQYSDSEIYDPDNPPASASPNSTFPQTTFFVIPGGVGDISGTVTGAGNQPLEGVQVSINNGLYSTSTNASGYYQMINILPDSYNISFSKHGYHTYTQPFVLEEDDDLVINATLELLPQVILSGTIVASDTGIGIPGAFIHLTGYETYSANANAAGVFTIPNVFASHTYNYIISAPGYTSLNGTVVVPSTNYNMGTITMNEVAFAPIGVTAEANVTNTSVNISWLAPDPNALEITESFENPTFPPSEWSVQVTNQGGINPQGIYPTWCRFGSVTVSNDVAAPTDGDFQSGLFWDYNHQDEWLITPSFNCPPSAYLKFDGYVFLGSTNDDHYYVKITNDNGNNWTVLWDASAQTGGWNYYASPITIDLTPYSGQQVKLAFNAVDGPTADGLWYLWFIDNIYIGNMITHIRFGNDQLVYKSNSGRSATPAALQSLDALQLAREKAVQPEFFGYTGRAASRAVENGGTRTEPRLPFPSEVFGLAAGYSQRVLTGYKVWRLNMGQETNESAWTLITPDMITDLAVEDPSWATIPNGHYRWAVRAIYTAGVTSVPALSNTLEKYAQTGMIVGMVRRQNTIPIMGATITAAGITATSSATGAYTLIVPVGIHSVTASKEGFFSQTIENVTVAYNQTTTQNFILIEGSGSEEEIIPVTATAYNGNFPNPFNPETVISYSIKEAGHVCLEIYNLRGQLIKTLVDEEQARGHYKLVFDARDARGKPVSSGVYLVRMQAPGYQKTSRMLLMK